MKYSLNKNSGFSLIETVVALGLSVILLNIAENILQDQRNIAKMSAKRNQKLQNSIKINSLFQSVINDFDTHYLSIYPKLSSKVLKSRAGQEIVISKNAELAINPRSNLLLYLKLDPLNTLNVIENITSPLKACPTYTEQAISSNFYIGISVTGISFLSANNIRDSDCLLIAIKTADNFFIENNTNVATNFSYLIPVDKIYGLYQDINLNLRYLSFNNLEITENQPITKLDWDFKPTLNIHAKESFITLESENSLQSITSKIGRNSYLNLNEF